LSARALIKQLSDLVSSQGNLRQNLKRPLYRNAIYLMIHQVLTAAFGLIFWVVAARLYAEDDVGRASAGVSAILLLSMLASLGLDYALVRFVPDSGENSAKVVNSSLTISGLASLLAAAVFLAGLDLWSPALLPFRERPLYAVAFVVFVVMMTTNMLLDRVFVSVRRSGFTLAKGAVFNVLRVILLVPLAVSFGAFGMVSAWGVSVTVAVVIGAAMFLPLALPGYRPVPKISRGVMDPILRYSLTNFISVLLWSAPSYILPLMVANLVGVDSNAYFYVAWSIANLLFQIPTAISFSLFAEGSIKEERLGRDTRRSLKLSFLVVIPAATVIAASAGLILTIYQGEYAANGANLLRILAVSSVPVSVNCMYFVVERVRMKLRNVVIMSGLLAVGTLGLSWLLLAVTDLGILGVGIAWLSSQTAAAIAVLFLLRRMDAVKVAEPGTER
jgi:O-antigen/teichoic acid export membrane protein